MFHVGYGPLLIISKLLKYYSTLYELAWWVRTSCADMFSGNFFSLRAFPLIAFQITLENSFFPYVFPVLCHTAKPLQGLLLCCDAACKACTPWIYSRVFKGKWQSQQVNGCHLKHNIDGVFFRLSVTTVSVSKVGIWGEKTIFQQRFSFLWKG